MSARLRVLRLDAVIGSPLLESQLDQLDTSSASHSFFSSAGVISALLEHDERREPGERPLLLAAVEDEKLVGFLALRRVRHHEHGLSWPKLELLASYDSDHPGLLARPADTARCAEAFWKHLLEEEPGWHEVELVNQEPDSPLVPRHSDALPGCLVRTMVGVPISLVHLPYRDLYDYFHSIPKKFRGNVGRLARRLLASGRVEFISSDQPRACAALLDLYLDVERRSWKKTLGVGRHPERIARYRALCAPDPLRTPVVQLLLLDGVPISAMVCMSWAGELLALDTSYDADYGALGPGNLSMLLAVREALRRKAGALNLFARYGYYKSSWGAEERPTTTVSIARAGTLPWARDLAAQVVRRVSAPHEAEAEERFNEARRLYEGVPTGNEDHPAPPERSVERALAKAVLARIDAPLERLSGADLLQALPFEPHHDAPTQRAAGAEQWSPS